MRRRIITAALALLGGSVAVAAQEAPQDAGRRGGGLMERFDANGDGSLDAQELEALRTRFGELRERLAERRDAGRQDALERRGGRQDGDEGARRAPLGPRGQDARGRRGPGARGEGLGPAPRQDRRPDARRAPNGREAPGARRGEGGSGDRGARRGERGGRRPGAQRGQRGRDGQGARRGRPGRSGQGARRGERGGSRRDAQGARRGRGGQDARRGRRAPSRPEPAPLDRGRAPRDGRRLDAAPRELRPRERMEALRQRVDELREKAARLRERLDANGDGRVDTEERDAARERLRELRGEDLPDDDAPAPLRGRRGADDGRAPGRSWDRGARGGGRRAGLERV